VLDNADERLAYYRQVIDAAASGTLAATMEPEAAKETPCCW